MIKVSYETWDSIFNNSDVNMIFFSQYMFKDILFQFPSKKKLNIKTQNNTWIILGIKYYIF